MYTLTGTKEGVVMSRTHKRILIVATVLFVFSILFPPWLYQDLGKHTAYPVGHLKSGFYFNFTRFLFNPPPYPGIAFHILVLEWFGIGVATGVALLITKTPPKE